MEEERILDTAEKIRLIAEFFHLNSAQFAKKIGVSPSKIYDINRGQIKNFSPEILEKIFQNCPEISPIWLMTGKGEMTKNEQRIGDIKNSNVTGVNVHGQDIVVNPPIDINDILSIVEKHQKSVEKFQEQIDRLITIIEKKI